MDYGAHGILGALAVLLAPLEIDYELAIVQALELSTEAEIAY